MLVHVVLFRPKADLDETDRATLVGAIERAARDIPGLRSFRVGSRTMRSAGYAALMPEYPYLAIIEVADEAALAAYLEHPVHAELAAMFWRTSDAALAYDFTLQDARDARALLGD